MARKRKPKKKADALTRKVSISKEIILESALNMLIRDGY